MIPPGASWADQESPNWSGGASCPAPPPVGSSSSPRSCLAPRAQSCVATFAAEIRMKTRCLPHPQGHTRFGQSLQKTEIFKGIEKENNTTEKLKPNPSKTGFGKVKGSVPTFGLTLAMATDALNLSASLLKMTAPRARNICAHKCELTFSFFSLCSVEPVIPYEGKMNAKAEGALLPC